MVLQTRRHIARIAAAGVLALGIAPAAPATDLRRCEDAQGHITYSNEACPAGTARQRAVDSRSAVEVPAESAADKAHPGARAEHGVVPTAPSAAPVESHEQAREDASEQRKSQVARCDDLVRRIEYGQQELLAASDAEHASAELGVRRLQEEHKANCEAH